MERLGLPVILDGLVAGLAGTAAMSFVEYPIRRIWRMDGLSEWYLNQAMMARLSRRPAQFLVTGGLLLCFLNGGLAGIVFVLSLRPLVSGLVTLVVVGVIFGLGLWLVELLVMKPLTGMRIRILRLLPLVVSLGGHLLYGGLLGLLAGLL